MSNMADDVSGLWDERDEFFYDVLALPDGHGAVAYTPPRPALRDLESLPLTVRGLLNFSGCGSDASIWDLVVGHDEAVAVLREVVASERVPHAWLFTGPPGIGKLHTARVFAAALNCPAGGDGTCDSCRRILRGVHPDVHLIVPEGENLLVEDVRAVREEASRSRHEARTAVFVLDEADRMTEAAANALLKVLEEPPPQVVFVLVARSADAVVETVPSRARAERLHFLYTRQRSAL